MAKIIGINPATEEKTTAIKEKIKSGQYLNPIHEAVNYNEVLIGTSLAEVLGLNLGDDFVLVGQGADGSISNDIFKVVAILKGDNFSSDRNTCYMHIKVAQKFLSLDNRIHEIAVALSEYNLSESKTNELNKIISSSDFKNEIIAKPWQEIERQFYNTMIFEKKGMRICLFIIVLIVAIGVLNTVLMAILERTVEYGVLKALGTRPTTIFQLIILESAILAGLSVAIGFVISLVLNFLVARFGIDYPAPIDIGGFQITTMYGLIYTGAFLSPAIVTFFTAVLVSIFPAFKAMKIDPIEAMRST
jgi:putative ABC transport system permease protein